MNDKSKTLTIAAAIVLAGLIIASAVIFSSGKGIGIFNIPQAAQPSQGNNAANNNQGSVQSNVDIRNVKIAGEPFIGNQNAPVIMAYWFDYQCPFCDRFETQVLPTLIKNYVETGKLKIVFKDFQFLGADSNTAGLIGRAIWQADPKAYFAWREKMYESQGSENSDWASQSNIFKLIENIPGLNLNRIKTDLNQNQSTYQAELNQDKTEAGSFGIQGTPGFIIGRQEIIGAQPLAVFEKAINKALSQNQK